MGPNSRLLERLNISIGFVPVNTATAANPGDWVSMEKYRRCAVILVAAAGAEAEPPTLSLWQASSAAGASSTTLSFPTINYKSGADLQAVDTWTEAAVGAATFAMAAGNTQKIVVAEVKQASLTDGMKFISASVADVGNTAQLACLIYVFGDPVYPDKVTNMAGVQS